MSLRVLLSIFILVASTTAQNVTIPTLECIYAMTGAGYVCNLRADNPNGLDDITSIVGVHLEGRSDSDVVSIYRTWGSTANVPQVDFYRNLRS